MSTQINPIQNQLYRQTHGGGGCGLQRIVRVGDHSIKVDILWAGGTNSGRHLAFTSVWTDIGWKKVLDLRKCQLAGFAVAALYWNASTKRWDEEAKPGRGRIGVARDSSEPLQDCVYALFDKDADVLIDKTVAVLGGAA